MTLPILKQIADLHGMPQDQLKALWQEYFGTEPPAYRKGFLVKGLAQRIQELTFGGLAAAHQTKLNALVEDKPAKRRAPEAGTSLLPGTKLVRDWQGVAHHVTVIQDGYEYQGRRFKSLSAIANLIAGTRWNGWTFFGVTNPNKREKRQ